MVPKSAPEALHSLADFGTTTLERHEDVHHLLTPTGALQIGELSLSTIGDAGFRHSVVQHCIIRRNVLRTDDAGRTQFSEVQGPIKAAIKQQRVTDQIEGEAGQAGAAPVPPLYADARSVFASSYLQGEGLEIGALHWPLAAPSEAKVRYVDRKTVE